MSENQKMGIGKAVMIEEGQRFLVLGIGPIISEALQANEELKRHGIDLALASMGSIKPLDIKFLISCVNKGYTDWINLEEHHKVGGLGSTLLEWISEEKIKSVQLQRVGVSDHFVHKLGDQSFARSMEKLSGKSITNFIFFNMTLVDLDFDNTLAKYDSLFHKLATEKA